MAHAITARAGLPRPRPSSRSMPRSVAAWSGLGLAVAALGCAPKPVTHTVNKVVPATAPDAAEETAVTTPPVPAVTPAPPADETHRDAFRHALARKLADFDAEIEAIRMKVMKLEEAAQAEWRERIAALVARRDMVEAKLRKALEATAEAWDHLREDAEHAWNELERALGKTIEGL